MALLARHVVRQVPVREGEGFDLLPGERVIGCEWDPPIFRVIVLLNEDAPTSVVITHSRTTRNDGRDDAR